jgi:recombination protein RecT
MSSNALQVITDEIHATRTAFESALVDKSLKFEREAGFALQILGSNDYALRIAMENRQSVVNAVTNVAAIGISLNPALKLAYLVPRDGKICLDISYMGLVHIAIDSGSIKWAQAEVVYAGDVFKRLGYDRPPQHEYDAFSPDRGEVRGVYVVAKTVDSDYLTQTMTTDEVNAIRDRSTAWKAWVEKKKKCPWVTDWSEMAKKTVIKRAYKSWPKTQRLAEAIQRLNVDNEEGLAEIAGQSAPVLAPTPNVPADAVLAAGEAAAAKGVVTLKAWWEHALSEEQRGTLKGHLRRLKATATEADAKRTIDNPPAREPGQDDDEREAA